MKITKTFEAFVLQNLEDEYDIVLELWDNGKYLELSRIEIPKSGRGQGIGTEVMEKICKYADERGIKIYLTPSTSFGATSKSRLEEFYKGFGFINKPKDDFSNRNTMVRMPGANESLVLEKEKSTKSKIKDVNKKLKKISKKGGANIDKMKDLQDQQKDGESNPSDKLTVNLLKVQTQMAKADMQKTSLKKQELALKQKIKTAKESEKAKKDNEKKKEELAKEAFNDHEELIVVDEGFFDWFGKLFTNPIAKRQLRKLGEQLTATIIEINKLKMEGDPLEEFESELKAERKAAERTAQKAREAKRKKAREEGNDDYEDDFVGPDDYDDDFSSNRDGSVHEVKIRVLEEQEEAILARMDILAGDNETLQKYISKVKFDSKLAATEELMKMADSEVRKVLGKIKQQNIRSINNITQDLAQMKESHELNESLNKNVEESASTDTYNDYPAAAKKNAKKAIDWKEEHGRDEVKGGTEVGWQRAHQLAKGEALSRDVVSRMAQFNRHRKNSKLSAEFKDEPWKDNGYIAWLIWGGDEGVDWAMDKMEQIKKEEETKNENTYTMKKVKMFEDFVNEATTSWKKMMKGVRAGETGPWSIVAIEGKKVVGQRFGIVIQDLIPAEFEALRKECPKAQIHIEDATGAVVWNESMVNEGDFVVYADGPSGKELLGTFHNKSAAERYKKEIEVDMLDHAGEPGWGDPKVDTVGMMSKNMWDKKEAPYIKEAAITEGKNFKVGQTWEWHGVEWDPARKNNYKTVKKVKIIEVQSNGDVIGQFDGQADTFIVRDASKYLKKKLNESTVVLDGSWIDTKPLSRVDHTRVIKWIHNELDDAAPISRSGRGYTIDTSDLDKEDVQALIDYLKSQGYLQESTVNENEATATQQLADEISGELYKSGPFEGSVVATTTTKTWDDGVPVLKYLARGKAQSVKVKINRPFDVVHDVAHGWFYFTDGGKWYGLHVGDGYSDIEDLPFSVTLAN